MAVENLLSAGLTNSTSTPLVKTNRTAGAGKMMETVGVVVPTAASDIASTYRFCQVPSNCRLSSVILSSAVFTTTGVVTVGLFYSNGGAAISAAFFATGLDLKAAAQAENNITYQSGTYTLANSEKPLWQALGLTSDPGGMFDIVAKVTTAFSGGQTMVLKARYVV